MAILSKGTTFATAQQVTSTNLNALVDSATFVTGSSGTTDDSTLEVNGSGRLQVKDLGITSAKLASNAVTAIKITDGTITPAKLSTGAPTWGGGALSLALDDAGATITAQNGTSTANRFPTVRAINYNGGQSGYPTLSMYAANGSSSSPSACTINNVIGRVFFYAHNGTSFQSGSDITVYAAENHSGSAEGTIMTFSTTSTGATSSTERMRISETGAVMLGAATDVPSASLVLGGTTKGLRLPVLTTVQRDAISSPAEGLMVYNTTTNKLNFYTGAAWEAVTSA